MSSTPPRPSASREHVDVVGFVRRLDWSCSPRSAPSSPTASGPSPASRATTSRATRATTSSGRRSPPASASRPPRRALRSTRPLPPRAEGLYGVTIVAMLLVFLLAEATRGSKRWIDIGPFQFQPSEFGKLLFVLALAGFLADRARRLDEPDGRAAGVGLGASRWCSSSSSRTSAPRSSTRRLSRPLPRGRSAGRTSRARGGRADRVDRALAPPGSGRGGARALPGGAAHRLHEPDADPAGPTYNVTQSITAVGSGGFDGRGVDGATQTRLDYLPEHATDFVFASFAEQRGFVGAAILLGLYLLVVWRGLRMVTVAATSSGRWSPAGSWSRSCSRSSSTSA